MSSRPTLKATKPQRELTGIEEVRNIEPNRIYSYGYKYFLTPEKILEIFGDRIAKSKKIRKAKIREVLKNTMHLINLQEFEGTVNNFLQKTQDDLTKYIIEVQSMSSSPIQSSPQMTVARNTSIKRVRAMSEDEADALADMMKKLIKLNSQNNEPSPTVPVTAEIPPRKIKVSRTQRTTRVYRRTSRAPTQSSIIPSAFIINPTQKDLEEKEKRATAREQRAKKREEIKEPIDVGLANMLKRTGL